MRHKQFFNQSINMKHLFFHAKFQMSHKNTIFAMQSNIINKQLRNNEKIISITFSSICFVHYECAKVLCMHRGKCLPENWTWKELQTLLFGL